MSDCDLIATGALALAWLGAASGLIGEARRLDQGKARLARLMVYTATFYAIPTAVILEIVRTMIRGD